MLIVYKGYEKKALESLMATALTDSGIDEKLNIKDEDLTLQKITQALALESTALSLENRWITYEEFSVAHEQISAIAKAFHVEICIKENNKYFSIYPLEVYDKAKIEKLLSKQADEGDKDDPDPIYTAVYKIKDRFYVMYHNYEYDAESGIKIEKRYKPVDFVPGETSYVDYIFDLTGSLEDYVENLEDAENYRTIGIKRNLFSGYSKEMLSNLLAYFVAEGKDVYFYKDAIVAKRQSEEFRKIAKDDVGIPNFKDFKTLKVYKNPDFNNEPKDISQEEIITAIANQIDLAKSEDEKEYKNYRDVFVTAPTGAGKSVMFQIPAIYAAKKYHALTIVISPLIELMNDQVENLEDRNYKRAARLNSDVTPMQKQQILNDINNGNIDIVYLSPEALLSYTITAIIGSRDIAAIIVDEAHIVTSWGQGFRPDYWYLGQYVSRLRKYRYKGGVLDKNSVVYRFPICTFTATAVYGNPEEGASEIIDSLEMRNPIKFIGEVKRNDISFDITVNRDDLNQTDTNVQKAQVMKKRLKDWIKKDEKALVYFPYNSIANRAYYADEEFTILDKLRNKIGLYTGQADKGVKRDSADRFKNGDLDVMFATKAFGMGIDIKDIQHVYHYAEAGNLNDYVQEIGRAARASGLTGTAHMDYYKKDMNFSNSLFGISALRQRDILGVIRVLSQTYNSKHHRNILVTPQAFETVFPKANDLEAKVKTALLTLEKDLMAQYKVPVIVTRPRSIFTRGFVVIHADQEQAILRSKYGKYFKFEKAGRSQVFNGKGFTSDGGDIYSVKLKELWEDLFSDMSFAKFKAMFYGAEETRMQIFGSMGKDIVPRSKVEIEMVKDDETFQGIRERALQELRKVNGILTEFKNNQGEFTMKDFRAKLSEVYEDKQVVENIVQGYLNWLDHVELNNDSPFANRFYKKHQQAGGDSYKLLNTQYINVPERILIKSTFLQELDANRKHEEVKYLASSKDGAARWYRILNFLSMFNIIHYDSFGGENPEIFIRINDPAKIRGIAKGQIKYSNKLVRRAEDRHKKDVRVLSKFILDLHTDEERWDYIERYFLGHDVLDEKETANEEI